MARRSSATSSSARNRREDGHPRGCCNPTGAEALHKAFKQALAERGLQRRRPRQPLRLPRSVRARPDRRRLSRGGLVRRRHPGRRRRDRRSAPGRRRAGGTAAPRRRLRQRRHLRAQAAARRRPPDSGPPHGRAADLRQPDRAGDADRARGRARRRQRDLHLDPRRQAAPGGPGPRPPPRAAGGDGDAHPAAVLAGLDRPAHRAALQRRSAAASRGAT